MVMDLEKPDLDMLSMNKNNVIVSVCCTAYNHDSYICQCLDGFMMQKPENIEYKQFGNEFVPNLSILDVMMFNSAEEINEMLDKFELI